LFEREVGARGEPLAVALDDRDRRAGAPGEMGGGGGNRVQSVQGRAAQGAPQQVFDASGVQSLNPGQSCHQAKRT